jgi:phosphocarrier protein FPr
MQEQAVLTRDMVVLGARPVDRFDAIRQAGEVLVRAGCAAPPYIAGMAARERVQSTYLGSGIAIPHGEISDLQYVYKAGVSVLQLAEAVEWEPGEFVSLVIGLASANMQHAGVFANLVEILQAPAEITSLVSANNPMIIVERLSRGRSDGLWS